MCRGIEENFCVGHVEGGCYTLVELDYGGCIVGVTGCVLLLFFSMQGADSTGATAMAAGNPFKVEEVFIGFSDTEAFRVNGLLKKSTFDIRFGREQ